MTLDLMDFKFTNHTPDGEGLLESLHRLNPDGFPDLIKKLMLQSDDLGEKHDSGSHIKDTPDFIEHVVDEWGKKADACFELICQEIEKVEDIQAWSLYCNLMMTGFAPFGTIDDRRRMMRRVEERLKKNIETGKTGNVKGKRNSEAFAERLLLPSMYLENLFLEDQDCDIYTSYWAMMERDKMEEEVWKAAQGLFPF